MTPNAEQQFAQTGPFAGTLGGGENRFPKPEQIDTTVQQFVDAVVPPPDAVVLERYAPARVIPQLGSVVAYCLSATDAQAINQRRQDAQNSMQDHIDAKIGTQIHVGNRMQAGEYVAATVVRRWGTGPDSAVNLQCLLDGNDTYWASFKFYGSKQGDYLWPSEVP